MKHLIESIATGKGRKNRKSSETVYGNLPKSLDAQEIVWFLVKNGFQEYDESKYTLRRYSEDHQIDVFSYKDKNGWISIKFCKPGDDYEFRMKWEENRYVQKTYPESFYAWVGKYPYSASKQVIYDTYGEFRDAVIEHYGW